MNMYLAELSGRVEAVKAYLCGIKDNYLIDRELILAMLGEKEKEAPTDQD